MRHAAPARSNTRRRLIPIAALAAIGAVVLALVVPMSAEANTVALAGVVRNASGATLTGVTVTALQYQSGAAVPVGTAVTSATGTFTFAALPEGDFTLSFSKTSTTYAQYFGDTSDLVQSGGFPLYAAGGGHRYLAITLAASGTLSGTVTGLSSGYLPNYTVRALAQNPDQSWSVVASTVTNGSGAYSLGGLEPKQYRLEAVDLANAVPTYSATYSGGASRVEDATSVGVFPAKATGYNFVLGKAGKVSGTVTGLNVATAVNLKGVAVTVYRLDGPAGSFTGAVALDSPKATTGITGTYTVSGLAPGYYTLEFAPGTTTPLTAGSAYGRTFLGGVDTAVNATYFHVVNGTVVTGQNIQLVGGSTVFGTAYEDEAFPTGIANLLVVVDHSGSSADKPSDHAAVTHTNGSGYYSVSGLGAGVYDVYFGSNTDSNPSDGITEVTNRQRIKVTSASVSAGGSVDVDGDMYLKDPLGLHPTVNPSIVPFGSEVGGEFAADYGVWSGPVNPATDVTYQWYRNGVAIPGATNQAYFLAPGDFGDYLTVKVTATDLAYGSASYVTAEAGPVTAGTFSAQAPNPQITGVNEVGLPLTAIPGAYTLGGVAIAYQWQNSSDGTNWFDIGGAINSVYVPTNGDYLATPYIRALITATRAGYDPVVTPDYYSGSALTTGSYTVTTQPTVVKTASTFSVTPGVWSPATFDTTTTTWSVYQSNGSIVTSTGATLPVVANAGKYITVQISHQQAGIATGYSNTIVVQTGAAPVASGSTALVGTPQVGSILAAPSPVWTPGGGTSTYQWQYFNGVAWANIVGATSSNYTPVAANVGKILRVVTTQATSGYATALLKSAATTPVILAAPISNNAVPNITGEIAAGITVTVGTGTWIPTPTSYSYQWKWDTSGSSGPWTKITGATAASYAIPGSLRGKYLAVDVTAKLAGYNSGVVESDGGFVFNGPLVPVTPLKVTHIGADYTAVGATWNPAPTATTYSWYVYDGTNSPILQPGHLATFTAPAHARVELKEQADLLQWDSTFTPQILVQKGDIQATGVATLTGGGVGAAISISQPTWSVTGTTNTYQWQYLNGTAWTSISGATGATYSPSASFLGRQIRVVITASLASYNSLTVSSAPTTITTGAAPTPGTATAAPGINGYDGIGQTMTALPGTWSLSGLTFHYQWALSTDGSTWTPVLGATAVSYVIPDAAYNTDYIGVTITASRTGYANGSTLVSTFGTAVSGQFHTVSLPTLTKAANGTFTLSAGVFTPAPTLPATFEWDVYDPATDNATVASTTNSYHPVAGDAGKLIQVTMYPNRPHYNTAGFTFTAQAGSKITAITPLTVTGSNVIGSVLTANWVDWSTVGPFVATQWYRSGVAIPGTVNQSSYTQVLADLGKVISVKISLSKSGYVSNSYTLASPATISDVVLNTNTIPAVVGTPKVGSTVTANPGTWNIAGLTFAYQWLRDGTAIPNATQPTYLLTASDLGESVLVQVTASKPFYVSAQASSVDVTVSPGSAPTNSLALVLPLSGTIGQKLTPTVGSWNLPVTVLYDWQIQTGPFAWSDISGANSTSYTLSAADGLGSGSNIRLVITATKAGYTTATLTSNVLSIP